MLLWLEVNGQDEDSLHTALLCTHQNEVVVISFENLYQTRKSKTIIGRELAV